MITKHIFHTAKGDGPDSTFVKPSDWNAEHDQTVENGAVWLGRDPSGPGAPQEFAVDYALPDDDFTMMTKAQVQAAIAAAVAGIDSATTGDLTTSLVSAKAHWLLLDGKTIGPAASTADFKNDTAQPLFNLLWGLNANTWPVTPDRGASAGADWAANKVIPLPDARGCVIGMLNGASTVNTLIDKLGLKVGADKHTLSTNEIPNPDSPSPLAVLTTNPHGPSMASIAFTGGTLIYDTGLVLGYGGQPHTIVQPTIGANIFIKL